MYFKIVFFVFYFLSICVPCSPYPPARTELISLPCAWSVYTVVSGCVSSRALLVLHKPTGAFAAA